MNTTTYKIRFSIIGIILGAVCIAPMAMGADLTVTKTWVPDETLTASDLNTSFNETETAVNSKQDKVNVVTVFVTTSVPAGSFACAIARCPASHPVATGGGVVPENVLTMVVTMSSPRVADNPMQTNDPDGQYGNPDGWQGCALNNETVTKRVGTSVICTDL